MKNPFATLISFLFMAFGFVSIVWVASSFSGRAHSQNRGAAPAPIPAPVPGSNQPAKPAPLPQQQQQQPPPPQQQPQAPQDMAQPMDDGSFDDMGQDPNSINGNTPGATEGMPLLPGINPEGYTYDPTGRRDPFMPFGTTSVLAQPMPMGPSVPATLLPPSENSLTLFDLTQLRVVAIVWDVKDPKAMIMDPKGKLHMLHKDSAIGRNNGFVYAIREGEVVVIEPTLTESGSQSAASRVMYLNGK